MKYIVTHSGTVHRDDFLSVCFLLGMFPEIVEVFRRDPTPEELVDPEIVVVDVGGKLDPSLNNFDHHQDKNASCALVQVLKGFGLYEAALATFKWLTVTDMIDVNGPFVTSATIEVTFEKMLMLLSPVEGQILVMFGEEEKTPEYLIFVMRKMGKWWLGDTQFAVNRMKELEATIQKIEVGGVSGIISHIEDRPSAHLQDYRDKNVPTAAFSICPDDRGKGWVLYRFNDHKSLNFSQLDGKEGILFSHKGGFIAKTSERISTDACLAFVSQAIVPPPHPRNLFAEALAAELMAAIT